MKTNTPNDIAEATENVHCFLRLISLSRIKSKKGGGYTLKNILIRSIVVGVTIYMASIFYIVANMFNQDPLFMILDMFIVLVGLLDITLTLFKASSDNEKKVRKRIDNLMAIDEAFNVKCPETYIRDRISTNITFFVMIGLRKFIVACVVAKFAFTYGITALVMFISRFLIELVLDSNYIYNIAKLKLLNYRVREMKKKIEQIHKVGNGLDTEQQFENKIDHWKMKSCYLKMYDVCLLFNESQGLQILLQYTRLIIMTITTIAFVNKWVSNTNILEMLLSLTYVVTEVLMMVALLVQTTSILQTSCDISLVVEKALVKKYFGSERESAAWEEFVELVHRCPLVLTAYDFFTLDYSLLGATFGTMVTYTIILTQLSP